MLTSTKPAGSYMKMLRIPGSYLFKTTGLMLLLFSGGYSSNAQVKNISTDSTTIISPVIPKKDSVTVKPHSPRTAAIRSAIFPGLGQIYNKKYWKLPIVYGAMGISAGVFFYNYKSYKDTKFAYRVKYNMRVNHTDSLLYASIEDILKPLSEESLRFYRNQYRRDI